MSGIKDSRFINADAVRDEDILLDNDNWLRARNQANSADINVLKVNTDNELVISDSASAKPVVMGAQLASDPTGVTGGFYYNTTDNAFRFYNGTSWEPLSGDDANRLLSNLQTTDINADLIFNLAAAKVKTKDDSGVPTNDIYIKSGDQTGASYTGTVWIESGYATGGSSTGSGGVTVATGASDDAPSGVMNIYTGSALVGASGNMFINTGQGQSGAGNLTIQTGNTTTTAASGYILMQTAGGIVTDAGSGVIDITTGAALGVANSGNINLTSGDGDKYSGNIALTTGEALTGAAVSGSISLSTGGAADVNSVSGGIDITTGGGDVSSGNITLNTGSANTSRGDIFLSGRQVIVQNDSLLRLPLSASAPTAVEAGNMYYDTTTNKSYTWDGTTWQPHW